MTLGGVLRRIHAALARLLLPPAFRARYGEELARVFGDVLADAERGGGVGRMLRVAGRELGGLVELALRQRMRGRHGARRERPDTRATKTTTGGGGTMGRLMQDLRFAVRTLTRHPVVTGVAVVTLAVGVGATTAVFSVVDGVVLHPLAYAHPDRVMLVGELDARGDYAAVSYETFRDWQAEARSLEAITVFAGNSVSVTGGDRPERIRGLFVPASYFDVVGVEPALGRRIAAGEDVPGGPRTAVLSHAYWQERFGGDPAVLGRTLTLNSELHTVVGVMPADFVSPWDEPAAWISLHTLPRTLDRSNRNLSAMALLAEDVSLESAREELDALARRIGELDEQAPPVTGAWISSAGDWATRTHRPLLLILLAAVAMVLLIACANVASLQLARAAGRKREMAIRAAMGGSRTRLMTQMLVENLLLGALGGLLGIGLAYLGVDALLGLRPAYARYFAVAVDGPVLTFGLGVSLLTGVLFGLAPAVSASRADVEGALRDGERGMSGGRRAVRFRSGLVVAQMALAVTLLIGAGLLTRSMAALAGVNPGFDAENLLTLEFRLTGDEYEADEPVVAFLDRVLERVRRIGGVEGAAFAQALPFSGNGGVMPVIEEGEPLDLESAPQVRSSVVSPGYFRLMRVPVVRGRVFEDTDRRGTLPVAVISRAAAERAFPGEDPLGKRIYYTEELDAATIVGVVGDVSLALGAEPEPHVYLSYTQAPTRFYSLAVRTTEDPMAVAEGVRRAFWSVEPDQPVWEVMPMAERIAGSVADERFFMMVLGAFSLAALFLASLGIYGVMAYTVARRSHEIGVRLALGAAGGQVRSLVLRQGLLLVGTGVALGVGAALLLTGVLDATLFGVSARDPLTFAAAPAVLALVALVACYLPARRATRVDPVETLQRA